MSSWKFSLLLRPATTGDRAWRSVPSRITLHRIISRLRSRIVQPGDVSANGGGDRYELADELERLSQAVARVTEFGFPLDLNLSRTDVRALLYRVFVRFQDEFAERAVSIELEIAPEVDHAAVDRLKLREAVGELLRNALAALPDHVDDWGCAPGSPKTGRSFRSRSPTTSLVPNSPS